MSAYLAKLATFSAGLGLGYYVKALQSDPEPTSQSLEDTYSDSHFQRSGFNPFKGYKHPALNGPPEVLEDSIIGQPIPLENETCSTDFPITNCQDKRNFLDQDGNRGFLVSYDRRTKTPNYVLECLTSEKLDKGNKADIKREDFVEDNFIRPMHRSTNNDYLKSGYTKGHMAAAANHKDCKKTYKNTFALSNMAPQVEKLNTHAWNDLEIQIRQIAENEENTKTYVCTGPLFLPGEKEQDGKKYVKYEVIGDNCVAVPTHFFKVLILEKKWGDKCFGCVIMANNDSVTEYFWDYDLEKIERHTGLTFFRNVKPEIKPDYDCDCFGLDRSNG